MENFAFYFFICAERCFNPPPFSVCLLDPPRPHSSFTLTPSPSPSLPSPPLRCSLTPPTGPTESVGSLVVWPRDVSVWGSFTEAFWLFSCFFLPSFFFTSLTSYILSFSSLFLSCPSLYSFLLIPSLPCFLPSFLSYLHFSSSFPSSLFLSSSSFLLSHFLSS